MENTNPTLSLLTDNLTALQGVASSDKVISTDGIINEFFELWENGRLNDKKKLSHSEIEDFIGAYSLVLYSLSCIPKSHEINTSNLKKMVEILDKAADRLEYEEAKLMLGQYISKLIFNGFEQKDGNLTQVNLIITEGLTFLFQTNIKWNDYYNISPFIVVPLIESIMKEIKDNPSKINLISTFIRSLFEPSCTIKECLPAYKAKTLQHPPVLFGQYFSDGKKFNTKGQFGFLTKGISLTSGETVCIKTCESHNQNFANQLQREIEALLVLRGHPNIVQLHAVYLTKENHPHELIESASQIGSKLLQGWQVNMVMELLEGGDLKEYLKNKKQLDEQEVKKWLKELKSALKGMHEANYIHRDLKPDNIMLTEASPSGTLKLIDFGLGRELLSNNLAATIVGSPLFAAPEIFIEKQKYSSLCDLWSVGIIIYKMLVGLNCYPFKPKNSKEITPDPPTLANLKDLVYDGELNLPIKGKDNKQISKEMENLLISILTFEENRISWPKFWAHEIFLGVEDGNQLENMVNSVKQNLSASEEKDKKIKDLIDKLWGEILDLRTKNKTLELNVTDLDMENLKIRREAASGSLKPTGSIDNTKKIDNLKAKLKEFENKSEKENNELKVEKEKSTKLQQEVDELKPEKEKSVKLQKEIDDFNLQKEKELKAEKEKIAELQKEIKLKSDQLAKSNEENEILKVTNEKEAWEYITTLNQMWYDATNK